MAPGPFQTAHYALGSGVMQLGFIFSKSISGDLQVALGYERFFLWTVVAGLPALVMLAWVKLPDAEAGQETPDNGPGTASPQTAA